MTIVERNEINEAKLKLVAVYKSLVAKKDYTFFTVSAIISDIDKLLELDMRLQAGSYSTSTTGF